jgi:bifunctional isochorismate lyase / aryl carrier protein
MRVSDYTGDKLDEKAAAWLWEIRSQVAPRPRLSLDPARAALLVIDMLEYFAGPSGRCFLSASPAIVPRIRALVSVFRELGRPVIYTRHGHEGTGDLGMLGRFFSDYIKQGEPDSAIIEALRPLDGETVIPKTTYDAFIGTELDRLLDEAGAAQVVVTGVLTHMCCETTARAAFCRGYEVYLPVDCVASSSEALHVASLRTMADAVAVLMSSYEVLQRCKPNAT